MSALDPQRTVSELKELRALTATTEGAQRVAWTEIWEQARSWFVKLTADLPVEVERDEAGNIWTTPHGERPESIIIGGHLDSVPGGGWLDGSLNVLAGLESLRRLAAAGASALTVRVVDWADEEGARFGRSLIGSSACSGKLRSR